MNDLKQKIDRVRLEDTRHVANLEASRAQASERRRQERSRNHNRLEWIEHYKTLAASLRASAEEYQRKAEALCKEGAR